MSYLIAGVEIKRPNSMRWTTSSQFAQNRGLDGTISRDYMGDDKNIWELSYTNVPDNHYQNIVAVYQDYKTNGVRYFETPGETITTGTLVHLSLDTRDFSEGGTDYLANFTLTLTEA